MKVKKDIIEALSIANVSLDEFLYLDKIDKEQLNSSGIILVDFNDIQDLDLFIK